MESTTADINAAQVLAFLKKHNLAGTEALLKEELKTSEKQPSTDKGHVAAEVSNVLSSYKSEGDPTVYGEVYSDLEKFVEVSLDLYKHELALILYPVFVHMYLELVYNGHEQVAKTFIEEFGPKQETFYENDIRLLSYITKKEHMKGSELIENFQTSQFTVRMSRDSYSQLRQWKRFMSERKHSILWNIIQEHLYLDVYEGIARNKNQIAATAGGMIGEANRQANRAKVYYGLLREPDVTGFNVEDSDEEVVEEGKPKKKKAKKESSHIKKPKNDPNAPPSARLPFPDLRDVDKAERARALRESSKRQQLGPDCLPSICFYSVMNASTTVTAVELCDDSSLLAAGMSNSNLKVWTLVPQKLKSLKSSDILSDIDRDADDVLHRMMDDNSGESSKTLLGHSGPIYALSFSPDRTTLLSCSEDGSIRLWSLQTWTCIVCYKGHMYSVWQVKFCPQGYYFASSGHDKTVRLWTTEQSQPLRIFVGHFSDVDCISFHPNSNYIASGSSDRSIRLWDCVTGNCVRLMTGHKASVSAVCFSPDGRFLASGGLDNRVLVWDIAHGHLLGDFSTHTEMITMLAFSRDANVLASASTDCSIAIWDFKKFASEVNLEEVNVTHNPDVRTDAQNLQISVFKTKNCPVLNIHFTRRNLLLAVGPFSS